MLWKTISLGWTASVIALALAAMSPGVPAVTAAEKKQEEPKAAPKSPPDARRSSPPDKQTGTKKMKEGDKKSRGTASMDKVPAPAADRSVTEAAIQKALGQSTSIEFAEQPLRDFVDYLRDYHRIQIQLDTKAMEEVGVASDAPITANVKGISLRRALNLVLRPLGLTYTVYDEVLLITTPDALPNLMTVEVYDVADLVACRDEKGQPWDDYDTLVHLIASQIEPTSWSEAGGPGAISAATLGSAKVVVVTHQSEIHRQIVDLLAQIRAIGAKTTGDGKPPVRARPLPTSPPETGGPENGKKAVAPRP